jgi:hypothetical protein
VAIDLEDRALDLEALVRIEHAFVGFVRFVVHSNDLGVARDVGVFIDMWPCRPI